MNKIKLLTLTIWMCFN